MHNSNRSKGFTLIELLIVIGIIGFLAAAILVAVDPVKRIQDSRNSQRWSEVNSILNAVLKHQVDNRAVFDGATTAPIIDQAGSDVQVIVEDDSTVVCTVPASTPGCNKTMDTSGAKTCVANLVGTTALTRLVPEYLAEIPLDPAESACGIGSTCLTQGGLAIGIANSGYYIARTAGNRIEIGSCQPEQGATINVKR